MINIEFDTKGELKIFLDEEGASTLKNYLTKLIDKKDTHYHLMTPTWGGQDLDETKIDKNSQIINQVLIQIISQEE